MNFRNLDLNLLIALDALLTERSVTRAGERIFRTQSATSGILSRLRLYFNDELLIRVGNTIELTPLAEQLIPLITEFISVAQHISEFKPSIDPAELEQIFVLAMSDYSADFIIPKLLEVLSVTAPRVRLRIRTMDYDYWKSLDNRETDFVILPPESIEGHGPSVKILTDRWVAIADASHYPQSKLDLATLTSAPFATVNYYHGRTQNTFERQFSDFGLSISALVTVPYFQMLPRLISGSNYLGIVHERTARRDAESFGLAVFDLPLALEPLTLCLTSHERSAASQPHRWMTSVIRGVCAEIEGGSLPEP